MTRLLLTPVEAAQTLGVGRTKIYELMASGALASIKIGRARRVPFDALIAFVSAIAEEQAA